MVAVKFLRSQEMSGRLRSVLEAVQDYKVGQIPIGNGSVRRNAFSQAAGNTKKLERDLKKLDHITLLNFLSRINSEQTDAAVITRAPIEHTMAAGPAPDAHVANDAPARRWPLHEQSAVKLSEFMRYLPLLSQALLDAAAAETIVRHRPQIQDPLIFGVECLVSLWEQSRGQAPRYSFNRGTFGDFAILMLGPDGIGFGESEVKTATRRVLLPEGAVDVTSREGTSSDLATQERR